MSEGTEKPGVGTPAAGTAPRWRRVLTPILVVVTVLVFTVTVPAAWGNRTLLNTDRYVATIAPLAEDPAVQNSIAEKVTDQVFTALDVQGKLADLLPTNLAFLSGPITTAAQGFVQDQVLKVVQSDAFETFWMQANRFVHVEILRVLEGEGSQITDVEGKVVLNLLPLVNLALAQIQTVASDLIGRDVTIPQVVPGSPAADAIADLEQNLQVDLPSDFGQLIVYDANELESVQKAVYQFQRLLLLLVVLIPVLVAVTLWVSPRKRRTLIQLSAGGVLGLVLIRRGTLVIRKGLFEEVDIERFPAVRVLTDQLTDSLFRYTAWLLAIVLVTLIVALVSGPYPWAVRLRGWVRDAGRSIGAAISGVKLPETERTKWIGEHRDALMLLVGLLAVLLLFFVDLSGFWFLVLAVVTVLVELALSRLGRDDAAEARG